MIHFDRQKYLEIAKTRGAEAALTQLHLDIERMELDSFEGEKGYDPQAFRNLDDVRKLSREIWDASLTQNK